MASFLASQSFHRTNPGHHRTSSFFISYFSFLILLSACSSSKYISRQAKQDILTDSNFTAAHVGISIYDASSNKYLYNYQGDKYFIPASNTKLFTCYAAMKHLGDSLVGIRYLSLDSIFGDPVIILKPSGDPTFLHEDFRKQPVYEFLNKKNYGIGIFDWNWREERWGSGWTWNDYQDDYMAERSALPMYGNLIKVNIDPPSKRRLYGDYYYKVLRPTPKYFDSALNKPFALYSSSANFAYDSIINFDLNRQIQHNIFSLNPSKGKLPKTLYIPYVTNDISPIQLLADTMKSTITGLPYFGKIGNDWKIHRLVIPDLEKASFKIIYSQPTDSLLKPMMHRSDNFFAEQTLLMVSNEMTGVMNDAKIIDSLLKTDYKDLPQKPRWVDGSGLSRYNLFSPNDFVFLLNKMKNDFSWQRITTILATGGEGTLSNYYINLKDRIFAKTGSLSNNLALSGFLITKQNKTLIFSVLVNNHMGNATQIRKAVEKFLAALAEKY